MAYKGFSNIKLVSLYSKSVSCENSKCPLAAGSWSDHGLSWSLTMADHEMTIN